MKLNYTFSNLCGVVYGGGNAIFSPDGKTLISPVGRRVTLFDLSSETSSTLPLQMKSEIRFIAINPAGTLLFVVDDEGRASLVSLLSRATLSFIKFPGAVTAAPQFSSDGRAIAVAVGRQLEVWRVPDFVEDDRRFAPWQLIRRLVHHQGDIVHLQWSGDDIPVGSVRQGFLGKWICTASEDLTCRVFKIEYRSEPKGSSFTPQLSLNSLKLQRSFLDKQTAAAAATVAANLQTTDGAAISQSSLESAPESAQIDMEEEELEASDEEPPSERKAPSSSKTRFKNSQVHRPLVISVHRHQPVLAAFHRPSPNEPAVFLLTLSKEGALFVWDFNPQNGRLASDGAQKFKIAIEAEEREDDGTPDDSRQSKHHNSVTNVTSTGRPGRWARLRSVAFRAGLLLVGFTDGIFGLFRVDPLLERCDRLYALSLFNTETVAADILNPGHGIDTCDLDVSGDWLAFGSRKTGQLLVWEWPSESYILRRSGAAGGALTCSAYSPDAGQLIATGATDGKIRLWQGELTGGECVATFTEHVGPVTALAFTKHGHVLVSASQDGSIRAFDCIRFRPFKLLRPPQPVQFSALAVDCSGEIIAAGTLDTNEIYLWSLQTGQLVDVFSGHKGPISALAFEPTRGRILASGSWDRTIRLWDIYAAPDAKMHDEPWSLESDVLAVSFRPDGVELTAATLSGNLVTWSVEGGMVLSTIEGRKDISARTLSGAAFHTICHSADGACLLAAGTFPAVALYHLNTRTLLKLFPLGNQLKSASERAMASGKGLLQPLLEASELGDPVRSVLFSPSGRSWSCLSPSEGLLIYSRNDAILFDPFDLTPDLSPETVQTALNHGKFLQAFVLALRLNITAVIRAVWLAIPISAIDLLVAQLPAKYFPGLLKVLAQLADPAEAFPSQAFPIQRFFTWLSALLKHHALLLKDQRTVLLPHLRVLLKAAKSQYADLAKVTRDNEFEIVRLLLEGHALAA